MNSAGEKTFSRSEQNIIRVALIFLKNDFDEEDLETLGYTEEELQVKINHILANI
jgi:hypothetical protein|tara:strand:- start:464 stop:628 length:165 start_codon:yes stop_codon:yes gene_type:complete